MLPGQGLRRCLDQRERSRLQARARDRPGPSEGVGRGVPGRRRPKAESRTGKGSGHKHEYGYISRLISHPAPGVCKAMIHRKRQSTTATEAGLCLVENNEWPRQVS
jgi:hypothetical protein